MENHSKHLLLTNPVKTLLFISFQTELHHVIYHPTHLPNDSIDKTDGTKLITRIVITIVFTRPRIGKVFEIDYLK